MRTMRAELTARRRSLVAAGLCTLLVTAVVGTPQLLGSHVGAAFGRLDDAQPAWLWLAALLVVVTLATGAQAWRTVIRSCGGELGRADAAARYAAGSAVNTLAPWRLGDVVRIVLFSRTLEHPERAWTSAGAYTTIGAARTASLTLLVLAGYAAGALPLWTVIATAVLVLLAVAVALLTRRRNPHTRAAIPGAAGGSLGSGGGRHSASSTGRPTERTQRAEPPAEPGSARRERAAARRARHLFDSYRALGRHPRAAAPLLGWMALSTAARVGAAAAIVSSLGVHHSLGAALLIVPALDAASLLPLTPGNVGLASGAVIVALQGYGIGAMTALTISLGLHAVEAVAGVVCGTVGLLALLGERRPAARRAAVALACAALIAAAVGAALLSDLA